MPRLLHLLAAAAAVSSLVSMGAAQDSPTADTVVATVNGHEITIGSLVAAREALPEQYQQLPTFVLFEGLRDQLVQQLLLAGTIDAPSAMTRHRIAHHERSVLATSAIQGIIADAASDEALQAAYDQRYPQMEWNASHILVETPEEARDLIGQLEGGADFAELAQEFSTGPSGPNGGELGWFGPGRMVPEFELAVSGMEDGTFSAPIKTQFGWHVIRLNESRENAPPLEEVRAELVPEIEEAAISAALDELTANAVIKVEEGIDPEALNDPAILSDK